MPYNKPYVEFHNGHRMPIVGMGTGMSTPDVINEAITSAIDVGYRHIDTALMYRNEKAIGETLKRIFAEGKIKREDLFVVTKLPPNGMRASDVKNFLKFSLANLQLDYVDLYLVHSCIGFQNVGEIDSFPKDKDGNHLFDMTTDLVAIWKVMEELVDLGLAKSIGVSNWSVNQLQRILDICRIKPANIQIECHAYFQRKQLVEFCQKNGITVCAYAPIGSPGFPDYMQKNRNFKVEVPHLLSDPLILELAKKYKKEPSQILLRFLTQRGIVVIPKSNNLQRMKSNLNSLDFNLETSDIDAITALDGNQRIFNMKFITGFEKHPEAEGYLM